MGIVELRNKIIKLLNTDDIDYLKDVFEFAERKKPLNNPESNPEIPIQIQKLLIESQKQADSGETTSHTDVMAKAIKRYNLPK